IYMSFRRLSLALIGLVAAVALSPAQEAPRPPFTVKIIDEKAVVVEADSPVDPAERIRFQNNGNFFPNITDEQGRTLHLSHFPTFKIDEAQVFPGNNPGGRFEVNNGALPKTASGKARKGYMNVYSEGDIRITQMVELAPSKAPAPGQKRRMD